MLTEMSSGRFFSIEFTTANTSTGKGGKLVAYSNAVKLGADTPEYLGTGKKSNGRGFKRTPPDNEMVKLHLPEALPKDRIKAVHIYLITKFNGQEVV